MLRVLLVAITAVLVLAGTSLAADFSLVINDDSVQGIFSSAFNKTELGESMMVGRVLYNDDKDTVLGSFGAGVIGDLGNVDGLKLGAQLITNLGTSNKLDTWNVGLGLVASYQPPQMQGLGAYGRAQYAPKLLSFLDSERMWETAVGVNYNFTPQAAVLVEYQNTEIDFERVGKRNVDESVRVGVKFYF